jgi:hypothetical protein
MKSLLLSIAFAASLAINALANDTLPFPVTIGGQKAKEGTPFASIEKPVSNNAELAVDTKAEMIIVNVTPTNAKGEVTPGGQVAIILMQGTNKTNLDKTMDGKKIAPGNYTVSIVNGEKTALVRIVVQ